jgi:hypothetical protein
VIFLEAILAAVLAMLFVNTSLSDINSGVVSIKAY